MSDSDNLAIRDGQKVVFIGDSITDCGRRAEGAPLGAGYVRDVVALITSYAGRMHRARRGRILHAA